MQKLSEPGQSCTIILTDPEAAQSYTVNLSKQDHDRALKDYQYATSLLEHAKTLQRAERVEVELTEDEPEPRDAVLDTQTEFHEDPSTSKWTYDATNALIASMHNYMEDFGHPRKRKLFFGNVSNDLLSQGFVFSEQSCKNKFKSLERTYKSNKDKNLKSGRGASRFYFYHKMEELLGNKPANKNDHTLESSSSSSVDLDIDVNTMLPETPPLSSPNPDQTSKRGLKRKSEKEKQKQKRHDDRMNIEKEKLEVEKEKVQILQKLLDKMN